MSTYAASFNNTLFVLVMVVLFIVMLLKKQSLRKIIVLELFLGTLMILIDKNLLPLYQTPKDNSFPKIINSIIPFQNLDATINVIKFSGVEGMNEKLFKLCLNSIILYSASSVLISGALRLFPLKSIISFLIGFFVPSLVLCINIYLYLNSLTAEYNLYDTAAFIFIIVGAAIGTLCSSKISNAIANRKKKLEV